MNRYLHILILFFTSLSLFGQNGELEYLKKNYKSFNYKTVIELSNTLLTSKSRFSREDLTQIYTLKAASEYLINEQSDSRKSFIEILKISENYELNTSDYSPKIIEFFSEIKSEFIDLRQFEGTNKNKNNRSLGNSNPSINPIVVRDINSAIGKSIILPGWGHLSLKNDTKGWLLTSAGVAGLGSMLYYIFDTNNKENDYLSSINSTDIRKNYDKYNTSYKIRNTLIISYAALWIYSQIDLLFISTDLGSKNVTPGISKINLKNNNGTTLFSLNIPF